MQKQHAIQSLKLFEQLYSMTRVLNSWQLTADKNMADLAGWTSNTDRNTASRMLLSPEFLPKLLDFPCWFRRIVAPIKAILLQNQRYYIMVKEISKWCKTVLLTAQCINRKLSAVHLLHIHIKLLSIHLFFPYTTVWWLVPVRLIIGTVH